VTEVSELQDAIAKLSPNPSANKTPKDEKESVLRLRAINHEYNLCIANIAVSSELKKLG
jgi:hypothetical protein